MTHAYTTHSYVDNGGSYQLLGYLFISHVTMLDLIIHSLKKKKKKTSALWENKQVLFFYVLAAEAVLMT